MSLLLKNRGAMLLLMLNIFLAFTGIGLVVPIMPTYMNELGIGGSVVGLLVAAFSLTQLLVSPFAGRLSDKMGRKNHCRRAGRIRLLGASVRSGQCLLGAVRIQNAWRYRCRDDYACGYGLCGRHHDFRGAGQGHGLY